MSTFDLTMSINFLLDPLALLQIEPSFVQAANNHNYNNRSKKTSYSKNITF